MQLARPLDPVEIRVLGCLLEKQQTTPEYYPLTLNALVAACNQKNNREPVMALSEPEVRGALERLAADVLVWSVPGARAERWEHNLDRRWELDAPAKAAMTVLLLRGAQTPGEIRTRTERMHPFGSLAEVEAVLRRLASGAEPAVVELAREPGQKETRWMHLVGGPVSSATPPRATSAPLAPRAEALAERVAALEEKMADLTALVERLTRSLAEPR